MPSWNIHLEAGERLCRKMKLSEKEKEEFLFGCLLPDINNGYLNKRVKEVREHHETHWAFEKKSSLNFYAKYKDEVERKEPIYFGYLFHLYTDGFFNYDFYRKIKKDERFFEMKHDEKTKIKHNDFWKYDLKFGGKKIEIFDKENLIFKANQISGVAVDDDAISEIEEILNDEDFGKEARKREYIFYSEEKLDKLMDEMIESFCEKYLEKKNA